MSQKNSAKSFTASRDRQGKPSGGPGQTSWLEIDTRKLASVGVQLNALVKDLQAQNVILPSGNIDADGTRILLETSGDFPNVRAIETMLTRVGTTDSLVRLADLVTVRRGYVSPKVKPIYFNGRPAVVLSVVMQPTGTSRNLESGFARRRAITRQACLSVTWSTSRPTKRNRCGLLSTPHFQMWHKPSS